MKKILIPSLFVFLLFLGLQSCVPQIRPTTSAWELYDLNKPVVYILPLLDARPDTSDTGNFNRWASKTLTRILNKKGYRIVLDKNKAGANALEEDQLRGLRDTFSTAEEKALIAKIGPENAEWILLPMLQDFNKKVVLGCKATADVSGYLFHKKTGRTILWHKSTGNASVGLFLCPLAGQTAIENAFANIAYAFPKNPSKSK